MSSFSRRIACLSLLGLAACGFSPVYAPGGSGTALQASVAARDPVNRSEFIYLDALEARIGRPASPEYTLDYALSVTSQSIGITAADVTTRYTLTGAAQITLRNEATGETVLSDTVSGFTGYSTTGTQLATASAARDATERLMTILADRTVNRLLALDLPG
ncbi:LPS assembly lipoprotein LptE [Anianabacter salinae]|uniref:LPS assembly lipoprotein LptE n=1 Tax=Anianabacter salinae TaxID=2851023 RepID=UPI00225DD67E|nr:LPS assembly lipoprotein LptE [Anianabacter salinae]MBV0913660.1 hypothetical protein [Anianabacter salinae]